MGRRILYIPAKKSIITNTTVIFNTSENPSKIYKYDFDSNTATYLATLEGGAQITDIAMTENKLWALVNSTLHEYNITLEPFSIALNRSITCNLGSRGLAVKDENNLIGGGGSIDKANIISNPAVVTTLFNLPGVTYVVTGDILYKQSTNTYFVLYNHDRLAELSSNGTILKSVNTGIMDTLFGLFIKDGNLYVINGDGKIYLSNPDTLALTYQKTIPGYSGSVFIYGSAQAASF